MSAWNRVVSALDAHGCGPIRNGMALCPAHDDHNPSLSIKEGNPGVLMHCHAGCELDAILTALALEKADLFDGPSHHERTLPPRSQQSDEHPLEVEVVGDPTSAQIGWLKRSRRIKNTASLESIGAKLVRVWGEEWLGFPTLSGGWKLWALNRDGIPRFGGD